MPTPANRRPNFLRGAASLALTLTILTIAASDASAQLFPKHAARNQAFYGSAYQGEGYADRLGLRGHKRCENGGYYGPPQLYSRQYGTVAGYRLDPPFAPLRSFSGTGANGPDY